MKTNQFTNRLSFKLRGESDAGFAPRIFNPSLVHRPALLDAFRATDGRIRNIVVPLDGSAFAEHAIPIALGIAEQSGATLHLVHVFMPADVLDPFDALHHLYYPYAPLESLKRKKHKYLSNVVHKLAAVTPAFVTSHIVEGRAVSQSIEDFEGIGADLVVMATHGRGVLGRAWWGSIAHSMLQQISVPLILVRGNDGPVTLSPHRINHVLLPLDGTKDSEHVLDPIRERNLFPTARHTLLTVVGLEPSYEIRDSRLRMDLVASQRKGKAAARYLHTVARSFHEQNLRVQTKIVSSDDPVGQVVIDCARRERVDLIAVAHHSGGALARFFGQSAADELFRSAACPTMFVPSKGQP